MTKYNVKKIENTNTMITTLTTSCKKRDTAVNRFCRFLSEYDSCFKDSLLIALMTIHFDCVVDDVKQYKSVTETDEYYMTYTECGDVYQVIIDFKHDENTTHYKSLANTSVSDNTNNEESDNENKDKVTVSLGTLDDVKIDLSQETSNKNPADLKAEINKKYGVNAVYYDTDSILCDNKKQNVYVVQHNTNDNKTIQQTCNIKAYYDGKELTVPCDKYKCRQYAVEYIKALYENHVVEYETLFFIYHGKHVETITIENVLDVIDLIECNIDNINDGLKTDCYKKVREGFVNLCSLLTDNKVIIELITLNTSQAYTITKSRFEGLYTFESDTMCRTQSPESFARWLYFHTFTRKIILNYAEGESK